MYRTRTAGSVAFFLFRARTTAFFFASDVKYGSLQWRVLAAGTDGGLAGK